VPYRTEALAWLRCGFRVGGENHESRLYLSRHSWPVPWSHYLVTGGHKLFINARKMIANCAIGKVSAL
jgi:hypothetical protein